MTYINGKNLHLTECEYGVDGLSFDPDMVFETLNALDWVQRDGTPRQEYWDTTLGESYTYGNGVGERTYIPNDAVPLIADIRNELNRMFAANFHGCFLNRYDEGKKGIGWHSDDDPSIDHTKPIIVLSYGQVRDIQTKPIGGKGMDCMLTVRLGHGSIFIMPAGFQHTHVHRIPKMNKDGVRISLTFRALKEN